MKRRAKPALCFLAFPLEVGIWLDVPTFDTSDLADLVFLFRDGVGDQAAVRTGVRRSLWERLQGSS